MPDSLRKAKPGDPLVIPAATYNTFVDAGQDFLRRQRQQAQAGTPTARHSGIVLVRNDSGYDRDRSGVLGMDSPIIAPTDNEDAFKNQVAQVGLTPTSSTHAGRFVILPEAVANGETGLACAASSTAWRPHAGRPPGPAWGSSAVLL